ncbi:hypothetical protein R1flu_006721 [Riccia fluitans]|uniref:F-box domain-containing protein n=1 Tax=Riccia fluitans TaxID=41844 RepID=A0ABD1Z0W9_9MARC
MSNSTFIPNGREVGGSLDGTIFLGGVLDCTSQASFYTAFLSGRQEAGRREFDVRFGAAMEYEASSSRGFGDRLEGVKRRCGTDSAFGEEFGILPSDEEEQQADDRNYLDPNLWKNLPDDLHAWVLQKLPLKSLVKFRTVYHLSTGSFDKEVVVGMVMEHGSSYGSGYKIVVAGVTLSDNSSERTTLVYDSISNSWKKGGEVPRGVRFWRSGKPVSSKGYLYCITYNEQVWRERMDQEWPWSVLRYDLEHEKWSEVKIPRRNSILHQLVEHQGRILVVQRRPIDQTQMFTLELREDGEVQPYKMAKMPVELFPDAVKRDLVLGDWCVGQGDRVYIAGVYPENSWLDSIESSCYRPIYVDRSLGFGAETIDTVDSCPSLKETRDPASPASEPCFSNMQVTRKLTHRPGILVSPST